MKNAAKFLPKHAPPRKANSFSRFATPPYGQNQNVPFPVGGDGNRPLRRKGREHKKRTRLGAITSVLSALVRLGARWAHPDSAQPPMLCGWRGSEPVRASRARSDCGNTANTKKGTRLGAFFCVGAAIRIRTGDLMLTKHVLYQLSYSSLSSTAIL